MFPTTKAKPGNASHCQKPDATDEAYVTYVSGNRVYVGTEGEGGRFAISNDKGETWPVNVLLSPAGKKYSGYEIRAIYVFNGRIYIGTASKGVGISDDDGKTWRFVNSSNGLASNNVRGLVGVGQKIYAGSNRIFDNDGDLSISEDGGKTWRKQKTNEQELGLTSIAASGDKVYASHRSNGLSVSSDGGKTWVQKKMPVGLNEVYAVAASGNNAYAASAHGVAISRDGGNTWAETKITRYIASISVQCV